jgi:hypothetical protein
MTLPFERLLPQRLATQPLGQLHSLDNPDWQLWMGDVAYNRAGWTTSRSRSKTKGPKKSWVDGTCLTCRWPKLDRGTGRGVATSSDPGLEQAVQRAIHQLPERPRLAVILRRFQDLSSAEIAEALDLSESAIKVCAHRGDEKLRVLPRTAWEKMW